MVFGIRKESRKEDFATVIERELEVLYRVAKRLTLDPTKAEDLAGQTMLLAARAWDSFDGQHPRSWLIKIMKNEWMNQIRKAKIRRETNIDDVAEPGDDNFWGEVDATLEVQVIIETLDRIPEEYRLAVTLCDVEEMSYEEAAEALGVPIGTIRSRLFRGRKILRSKLVSLQPS